MPDVQKNEGFYGRRRKFACGTMSCRTISFTLATHQAFVLEGSAFPKTTRVPGRARKALEALRGAGYRRWSAGVQSGRASGGVLARPSPRPCARPALSFLFAPCRSATRQRGRGRLAVGWFRPEQARVRLRHCTCLRHDLLEASLASSCPGQDEVLGR